MRRAAIRTATALAVVLVGTLPTGDASATEVPMDAPRTLDTHHLFSPPASLPQWRARADELRHQILFCAGLSPMPRKTPLRPMVTGRIDGDGFTVEAVAIETVPGFRLCGSLYRPAGKKGPFPGIANPHGHWAKGRLEMQPDVPKAPAAPGRRGEGKGNLAAIGVDLARAGFVVFAYDMVGYNDTDQASHQFAGELRPWAWNVSLMGLQLWNSIRVVDYLSSLPDVDKSRIGCTGASGGGTQTFLLAAVDPRVKVSVPVNMVSSSMQGGCLCENGPGLRVGTDNVEIAALTAPRPQLLIACTGDWTARNPVEEWPTLEKVYSLYGAADKTACKQFNYDHNYNVESREAMCAWFGKWFLGDDSPDRFRERPFSLDPAAMRVWRAGVSRPTGLSGNTEVQADLIARAAPALPQPAGIGRWRSAASARLRAALGVPLGICAATTLSRRGPAVAIVAHAAEDREESERIGGALGASGRTVILVPVAAPKRDGSALWSSFYSCYNRAPLGEATVTILRAMEEGPAVDARSVDIIGVGRVGYSALCARALRPVPGKTVVDGGSLDVSSDDAFLGPLFAPGIRRAGDVQAAALLCGSRPVLVHRAGAGFPSKAVADAEASGKLALHISTDPATAAEIAAWVSRP